MVSDLLSSLNYPHHDDSFAYGVLGPTTLLTFFLPIFLIYITLLTLTYTQLSWGEVGLPTIMLAIIRSVY